MAHVSLTGYDASNKQIINVADGSAASDAATKGQLDAALRGLDWKQEVKAGSTANINLASPGSSIDGVTMQAGDRFLAKDQTVPAENGIYVWNGASAAATRANDADTGQRLSGATVTVQQGTVNGDRVYRVLTDDTITVGTTAITWGQVGGGTAAVGGAGLTGTGTLDVGQGEGIIVDADAIRTDPSLVAYKKSFDCAATTNPQTFTHSLGTKDVTVTVRRKSDDTILYADVIATSTSAVSVNFGGAPTAAQYRVTVVG